MTIDQAPGGEMLPLIHFALPSGDRHFVNPHARQPMIAASGLEDVLAVAPMRRRAVDVGAHVGLLTQALSQSFNRVEAFEPHPALHDCLGVNLAGQVAADLVGLRRMALTERTGKGFVNHKLQPDSQQGVFSTQSFPNALRVPAATLDSLSWEDVDLIRIGPAADATAVLAGARQTLAASQPLIWIQLATRHGAEDAEALEQALLGELLEGQGYRVTRYSAPVVETTGEAPDGETQSYCFSRDSLVLAPAAQSAERWAASETPQVYLGQGRQDQGKGQGKGKSVLTPVQAAAPSRFGARMGAHLWPTQMVRLKSRTGPVQLARTDLPRELGLSKPLHVPNGLGGLTEVAVPEGGTPLEMMLADQEISVVTGGLILSLTPEAAALVDYVSIELEREAASFGCIFQGAPQDFDSISSIRVDLPRRAVQDASLQAVVRFHVEGGVRHKRSIYLDMAGDHFAPHLVTCYGNRGGGGNAAIDALAQSLGAPKAFAEDGARAGVAVVWGVLRGSKAVIDAVAAANGIFYYIDHAYFGRGHGRSYRITKNRFEAGPVREAPTDRLEALNIPLVPWRSGGREIIVCPPTEYFKAAHDCHDWLEQTLTQLKAHTDRPIVIRDKPKPGETAVPLPEALETAHALVTHSSNVAIEAAVMGTPVFVSPSSAAAPVGLTDLSRIETPARPERWAWLAHLAYSQFSFQEMQSGAVWDLLRAHAARPLSGLYKAPKSASETDQEAAE